MSKTKTIGLYIFSYERFELLRASIISALLSDISQEISINVIDDFSQDPRIPAWLSTLRDNGIINNLVIRKQNKGIGRSRQWSARTAIGNGEQYTIWLDADVIVGQETFRLMTEQMFFWEEQGFLISMLGTFLIEALFDRHIAADEEHILLYHDGDLGVTMVRTEILKRYEAFIKGSRRWETAGFRLACATNGYPWCASVMPVLEAAHLGVSTPTIPTVGNYTNRKPWGNGKYMNPFPNILDYETFFKYYPESALELGSNLLFLMDEKTRDKILEADDVIKQERSC